MEGVRAATNEKRDTRPLVALVTVSYRSAEELRPMLASAAATGYPLAAGVIADNHPEEEVRTVADEARFAYLPLPNPGYGSAVNAGIAALAAEIEWIVVSNPDVTFEPGAIEALLDVGCSDRSIALVGPRIIDQNGAVYPSARAVPSLRTGIGHAALGRVWPTNPWTRRYLQSADLESTAVRDTGWLSGACLLVRRSAFEQIGGFDENFFMYFEDVDLGFRLGRAGFRNVYAPDSVIHHSGGHSTARVSNEMVRAHHHSARLFLAHKYPGSVLAPLRLTLGIGLTLRERMSRRRAR